MKSAFLFALLAFAVLPAHAANMSMNTMFNRNGLTIFTGPFRDEGKLLLEGLHPSEDGPYPLLFVCGKPGTTLQVEGDTQAELRAQFVSQFSECFEALPDGTYRVTGSKAYVFPKKNIASCGCSTQQIDDYFMNNACEHEAQFLTSDLIAQACQTWREQRH